MSWTAHTQTRIAGSILLIFLMATSAVAWSGCGVTFDVPEGWKTEPDGKTKDQCTIGISPRGWKQTVARSRYDDDKVAVHVKVLHGKLAATARKLEFEKNESGAWGIRGKESRIIADAVRFGAFHGWRSEIGARGFARDGAALGEDSRVWSEVWVSYLLHDGHGTIICIQYNQWNPDVKIDRPGAADTILSSLARSSN
ncbi:MAG TPA: hypothetical protein VN380_16765 [Thermoanaerobaculia bacterium]|jgi:hypothetical protein|nr:hypothetical protein [Thermoanaerobaculia bacterium]